MKAVINRKELLNALTFGGSMAGKNTVMPILSCVKMVVKNGGGKIISTDNEVYVSQKFSVIQNNDDIEVCINHKDFTNAIKNTGDENIEIVLKNNECTISYSTGKISIPYQLTDDFPKPNIEKNLEKFTVSAKTLFNWIKDAKNFISEDSLRPILNNVNIIIENNTIGVVATDANKLYYNYEKYEGYNDKVEFLLRNKAIPVVLSVINNENTVSLSHDHNNIIITTNNATIVSKKAEGTFPNFHSIIPKNYNINVNVAKEQLHNAIVRCCMFSNQVIMLIKMTIDEQITISSEDVEFAKGCIEHLICENETKDEITIGVNGKHITTCINSINSDNMQLKLSTPKQPIVLGDEDNRNKVILLMPMML